MSLDAFSTPRLHAERLTADHLAHLRVMDQDEAFMAHLGGVRSEAGTAWYLERNLAHWDEHGFGLWMLRERASGSVIGRAVLRHLQIDGFDEVEVGYGLMPAHWGQGLGTEVAGACIDVARSRLGLRSLVAITLRSNIASQRVLLKSGLAYEREVTYEGLPHFLFRARPL